MNNKNIFEKNAKIPDIVQQTANAAFREIYNRQDEPDEKPQKTYGSARATIIKIATSVVAAAITIVVLFVAIAHFGGQGSAFPGGNRFSVKVCAAELEPKASLPISLDVSKQTFGHYVDWTGCVNYQINFPVSVEGENISSVTFKADNAFIEVVSIDCPSIVKSGSPKTLADFNSTYVDGNDMSGHPIGKTEVGYYDSFSADYATLQNSKYLLNICSELTDRMDLYYLLNHEGSDDDSCAAYTYLLKDVKVTIEVTFNDGTKSSKTLRLYSKLFSATDKAVDGTEYTYNATQIFCYDEKNADDAVKKLISSQITRAKKICKAEEANETSGAATTTDGENDDDADTTVGTEEPESTANPEATEKTEDTSGRITLSGDNQKYANTFLTNFAEQYFYTKFVFGGGEQPGVFDVKNAKIDDVMTFVCLHVYHNDKAAYKSTKKGNCNYLTISFDKAAEVCGRYFNYTLKKETCKKLPAPSGDKSNQGFGPYYEDNKIWTVLKDSDLNAFREIAVVDHVKNNEDGTMTLYFTIYAIEYEVFDKLKGDDIKKYYALTPSEAQKDKTLSRDLTGVANVSITQSGKYLINTYETILDDN